MAQLATMYTQDHPSLQAVRAQFENPPEFVLSLVECTHDLQRRPIFPGWIYSATITAPNGSAYAQHRPQYSIELELAVDFPFSLPRIRFTTLLYHSQLIETGCTKSGLLQWNPTCTLVDVLQQCHAMLAAPLDDSHIPEDHDHDHDDGPTNAELEAMWRSHDPACQCEFLKALPCAFGEYAQLPGPAKARALAIVRSMVVKRDTGEELFQQRANMTRSIHAAADSWAGLSTFRELYEGRWRDEWFAPSFLAALRSNSFNSVVYEEASNVYSFDLFSPDFCARLLTEFTSYEASPLPKKRPNSMNNYGLIMNEIGLHETFSNLMQTFLQPLVSAYFLRFTDGFAVDHHHTFMVQYMDGQDVALDMHSDDSEVTLNVNICDAFQGAGLLFCGIQGDTDRRRVKLEYSHRLGRAVMHAGLHRHGAECLTSGKRYNIIMWCRSSRFRQSARYEGRWHSSSPVEGAPDLRCLSRTHDRDYKHWVKRAGSAPRRAPADKPSV